MLARSLSTVLIASFMCAACGMAVAQREKPDAIQTARGNCSIQPIQHGTLVLTWNGKTVYIDPYGGGKSFAGIAPPDLVVITDIHGDHLNLETLEAIDVSKAVFVVPQAVADQLPEKFKRDLVMIKNGENIEKLGIRVTATPMYNLPETSDSRHPKGRGNGYILEMGGKRIYISGDTEDIPEMRSLTNIDVAFVCMNGPTMDVDQAASAVLEFKPKIVYPFHYRGSDIERFRSLVEAGGKGIEVRLRDWYPE